jgi:hypothetical protein
VSERILTIPTHQWISEKDTRAILECVEPSTRVLRPAGSIAATGVTIQP